MPIHDIIIRYPQLLGYELWGGRKIVIACDNKQHAVCFTCIANIATKFSLSKGMSKEVADIQGNSTNNVEMNKVWGLLPLCGGRGHCSLEHDKEGEPNIIQPAEDITAETFQGIWYGALVESSMVEDEPRQMRVGGKPFPKQTPWTLR
jgi:hypothetical protein